MIGTGEGTVLELAITSSGKGGIRRKTYLDNVGGVPPTKDHLHCHLQDCMVSGKILLIL